MSQSKWKSEAQFQMECFKWFDRTFPEQRDRLLLQYNNPPNAVQAGMLASMGMRRGVADHLYFPPLPEKKRIQVASNTFVEYTPTVPPIWIEYKIKGGRQSDHQIRFMERVRSFGHRYELVIEELEVFINLINSVQ